MRLNPSKTLIISVLYFFMIFLGFPSHKCKNAAAQYLCGCGEIISRTIRQGYWGCERGGNTDKCVLDLMALCNCLDTATQKWQQALSAAVATAAQPFHLFVCMLEYQGRKRKKMSRKLEAAAKIKI